MNPEFRALKGKMRELASASAAMDFDEPDVAPEGLLIEAIWHLVKGPNVPYPTSRRSTR